MCQKILKSNITREEDPTGQFRNRKNAEKKLYSRLSQAEKEIKRIFRAIPKTYTRERNLSLNDYTNVYSYDITSDEMAVMEESFRDVLIFWLLQDSYNQKPVDFYYDENTEKAYRSGTLESIVSLNRQLTAASIAGALAATALKSIEPQQVLFSVSYQDDLSKYLERGFSEIKTLTDRTKDQVFQVVSSGMLGGKSPVDIVKDITKRFDVADSNAKRIVHTEINRAYNDSKMNMVDAMNELGINTVGEHISALLPNRSRQTHMARHQKFYTPQQQRSWWLEGANYINCYCSYNPTIVTK